MDEVEVIATFAAPAGDPATLSKASRKTIEALYRHPLTHNLGWSDVVTLFEKLGTVEHKHNHEVKFAIGGEHHRVQKPHHKDLTTAEVMEFRHMLTRAGWAPPPASPAPHPITDGAAVMPEPPDLMVVIEHHEARLHHLSIQSADPVGHVIKPYDPHHVLHHLSHKDHRREHGQRVPEDQDFYERIAQAIAQAIKPGGRVVLVGHGKGHSNAAHHLVEFLQLRHPVIARKLVCEVVADLSSLTAPQLLELGRRALSA